MNKYIKCEWIKIKKMHFVTYNMGIVLISILLSIQTSRGVDGIHPISTSSLIFTFSSALLYVQLLPALIVCLIIIYIYIGSRWRLEFNFNSPEQYDLDSYN